MKINFLAFSESPTWHKSIQLDYKTYRFKLILFAYIVCILIQTLLFLYDLINGFESRLVFHFISFFILLASASFLLISKAYRVFSYLSLIFSWLSFFSLSFLPFGEVSQLLVVFAFPQFSLAIKGIKKGFIWIFLFMLSVSAYYILSSLNLLSWSNSQFSLTQSIIIILAMIIISALSVFSEKQHEKYLFHLTEKLCFDDITNMPNKDLLVSCLKSTNYGILAIIQIDNFNDLGSIFGYNLSDHILHNVSKNIRNFETLFNYSSYHIKSHEFAIIISTESNTTELDAQAILYSLWDSLQDLIIEWDNIEIRPIFRLGGTLFKKDDEDILCKADLALKAGIRHKNPVTIFKNSETEKQNAIKSILKSSLLLENLKGNFFKVFYQPIVHTETHEIMWYESLIRIKNKAGSYESIFPYLEIAKSIGIYGEITKFVLMNATKVLQNTDKDISVNISLTDIIRPGFIDVIINCCNSLKNSKGKGSLILEIVETEELSEIYNCLNFLNIAHSVGCKIAIDDFGSGYSNMTNLIDLPVDIIKIDGTLIKKLPYDNQAVSLVSSISNYCKSFAKKTVAEYVENPRIYDQINELGIDYCQGYLFGHAEEELAEK